MALLPNNVYIALFVRADPPIPNDFHWALYLPEYASKGTKYHIVNEGVGWIAAHASETPAGILKSFLLVGLIRVAAINSQEHLAAKADALLRSHDNRLNDKEGTTCRTWLLEICEGDMEKLEAVVKDWGNRFADAAVKNVQPRPVEN
ncbi:uncharacterized protein DSM5745_03534 [Aspergillus mulundensis]|uniref:Uncharacterized protein n=1 Tax=Aspergillus mulundensis TaxID=1810919 RepID=A0A3D8SKW0_9EURO|nr:hypothetical protein DSM5745_03534 [Aspergillus mulundensis]RDW86892.1 hypothetical protein DSM5745_03534 [Aspergillus mulundensis]